MTTIHDAPPRWVTEPIDDDPGGLDDLDGLLDALGYSELPLPEGMGDVEVWEVCYGEDDDTAAQIEQGGPADG